MSSANKGVAANITRKKQGKKRLKVMCDALDTVFEMSKFIKYSHRIDTILEQLKREMAPDTLRSVSYVPLNGLLKMLA
jgi:hypothetical protein